MQSYNYLKWFSKQMAVSKVIKYLKLFHPKQLQHILTIWIVILQLEALIKAHMTYPILADLCQR